MNKIKQESDEDDDEYEEMYLYLDFGANLPADELNGDNLQIKMIGTGTDQNPIVQVNTRFFKGTYDYAIGTLVFFNENEINMPTEPNFQKDPCVTYQYNQKTNKVLHMKRIFVAPKDGNADEETEELEDLTKYEINQTYSEALAQFLKPGERAPRQIEDARENGVHLLKRKKKRPLNRDQVADDVESDVEEDPKDVDYIPASP